MSLAFQTYPTIRAIQVAVSERFDATVADLISARRGRQCAWPRFAGMWLARHCTLHSITDIGRHFGGRDHTTVMHALRRADELIASDPDYAAKVLELRASLGPTEYNPGLRLVG